MNLSPAWATDWDLSSKINQKKTNSAARVDKLGKKFKKSLDWTPELTSDLHHRHPNKQFSWVPLQFCKCCSRGIYLRHGMCLRIWAGPQFRMMDSCVLFTPHWGCQAYLHLCKRGSSYPRVSLSAQPMPASVALWATTCHGSRESKEVFDLLSCLTN